MTDKTLKNQLNKQCYSVSELTKLESNHLSSNRGSYSHCLLLRPHLHCERWCAFLAGVQLRYYHQEIASVLFVRAPLSSIKRFCGAWTVAKWTPPILHYPATTVFWTALSVKSQCSLKPFKLKPGTRHKTSVRTKFTISGRDSDQHRNMRESKRGEVW